MFLQGTVWQFEKYAFSFLLGENLYSSHVWKWLVGTHSKLKGSWLYLHISWTDMRLVLIFSSFLVRKWVGIFPKICNYSFKWVLSLHFSCSYIKHYVHKFGAITSFLTSPYSLFEYFNPQTSTFYGHLGPPTYKSYIVQPEGMEKELLLVFLVPFGTANTCREMWRSQMLNHSCPCVWLSSPPRDTVKLLLWESGRRYTFSCLLFLCTAVALLLNLIFLLYLLDTVDAEYFILGAYFLRGYLCL